MTLNTSFSKQILSWYYNTKIPRLPWQLHKTLYKTWLSEIMLQQTQLGTVIPYYQKFIEKFPTIFQLAEASLDEILHMWSGLGYYRRAINLHNTAKIIVNYHNGKFPHSFDVLLSLPGIGRSTAGAILSLGLNKHYPILDGNIKRILIRHYILNKNQKNQSKINNELWSLIKQLIPDTKSAVFNQAMMDLGRLICTYKHPQCHVCPVHRTCQSFLTNQINQYPPKNTIQKKIKKTIWWILLLIKHQKIIWLTRRSTQKIWKELFCFPEFNTFHELNIWLKTHNLFYKLNKEIITIRHTVSNINLIIQAALLNLNDIRNFNSDLENGIWYNLNRPNLIGIPKPVSIILKKLQYYCNHQ